MTNPDIMWSEIDINGGGQVLFDEFCQWAIQKNLDLEDDDDDLWIFNNIYNSIIFLFVKISLYVLIHMLATHTILILRHHLLLIDFLCLQLIHENI